MTYQEMMRQRAFVRIADKYIAQIKKPDQQSYAQSCAYAIYDNEPLPLPTSLQRVSERRAWSIRRKMLELYRKAYEETKSC